MKKNYVNKHNFDRESISTNNCLCHTGNRYSKDLNFKHVQIPEMPTSSTRQYKIVLNGTHKGVTPAPNGPFGPVVQQAQIVASLLNSNYVFNYFKNLYSSEPVNKNAPTP